MLSSTEIVFGARVEPHFSRSSWFDQGTPRLYETFVLGASTLTFCACPDSGVRYLDTATHLLSLTPQIGFRSGDQPSDIEKQIRSLVLDFISKPNWSVAYRSSIGPIVAS